MCLLLTTADPVSLTPAAAGAVAATRDGFALAEIDLEQRREGDVLGASQSGCALEFMLQVLADADLIAQARTRGAVHHVDRARRSGPGRHRDRYGDGGGRGLAQADLALGARRLRLRAMREEERHWTRSWPDPPVGGGSKLCRVGPVPDPPTGAEAPSAVAAWAGT